MCGLCVALNGQPGWYDTALSEGPAAARRHARALRLKPLLAPMGLNVRPWAGGLLLTSATGRGETVIDLPSLWRAAERLSGRRIDPLSGQAPWHAE